MKIQPCNIVLREKKQKEIMVRDVNDNRCRYHPLSSRRQKVSLVSQKMCPLAYLNLYPILFALHCSQDSSKLRVDSKKLCPLGLEGIEFKIYTTPIKFSLRTYTKIFICKLINLLIPFEVHNKNIVIEVVDEGKGCPLGIRKGDIYSFNLYNSNELCPAAFNSVYPFLDSVKADHVISCPDYRTHVRYSISDKQHISDIVSDRSCDRYHVKVQIRRKTGDFPCPIQIGQWYSIDQLIMETGIRCFTAFHVAFPYLYALYNGGQLGYLTMDRYKAGICCPNTALLVKYIVSKDISNNYRYQCIGSHEDCPRGISLNEDVLLNNFEQSMPFYQSLNDLYPVVKKIKYNGNEKQLPLQMELLTMNGDRSLLWVISKDT